MQASEWSEKVSGVMWPAEIGKQKCHCTSWIAHESLAISTPENWLQPVAEEDFQDATEGETLSKKMKTKSPPQNNQPTKINYWAKLAQQNKWWENDPSTSAKIQKTPEKIGLLYLNFHSWLLRLGASSEPDSWYKFPICWIWDFNDTISPRLHTNLQRSYILPLWEFEPHWNYQDTKAKI